MEEEILNGTICPIKVVKVEWLNRRNLYYTEDLAYPKRKFSIKPNIDLKIERLGHSTNLCKAMQECYLRCGIVLACNET